MQQMHQGGGGSFPGQGQQGSWGGNSWNGQDHSAMSSAPHPQGYSGGYPTNASAVDDLVSGAAREVDDIDEIIRMAEAGIKPPKKGEAPPAPAPVVTAPVQSAEATPTPAPEATEKSEANEKKAKKDKPIRMIYSDTEFSPEERMAKMPRYAFVPEEKTETALVDANAQPGVAGIVDE
jgi:hypothetical protein